MNESDCSCTVRQPTLWPAIGNIFISQIVGFLLTVTKKIPASCQLMINNNVPLMTTQILSLSKINFVHRTNRR